ncbi:hypothetical protein HNQ34_002307 [Anoxybacillus tepidamans]|uniref:Uncharacterized protein n=1 Tax=Anoxybacteroides tepidamans TaxID=265948 RepID=A0A7W8ISV1_9BACL|nr:hypothetical protein [Anoxybacillus tepidamans]MBB5325207.1 hypothetical protein [Anoxybacillus tepidamans]
MGMYQLSTLNHWNVYAKKQQEAWIAPTLLNGWVNFANGYETSGYFKDELGIVHLKGTVKGGTNNIIFYLPIGYRPLARLFFPVRYWTGTQENIGIVQINPDGGVVRTLGTDEVAFDSISFRAGQ